MKPKAVFLDRDGTLNELARNPVTGDWESPHRVEEVKPAAGLAEGLRALHQAGYLLFVVSNQPSAAKGKCSLQDIEAVHEAVKALVATTGMPIQEWLYCYHHPQGTVASLSGPCDCRKPGTKSVKKAEAAYGLDLGASWFVGDQDADVGCGRAAGLRTIGLQNPLSASKRVKETPHFKAADLQAAARIILNEGKP